MYEVDGENTINEFILITSHTVINSKYFKEIIATKLQLSDRLTDFYVHSGFEP